MFTMINVSRQRLLIGSVATSLLAVLGTWVAPAQQLDTGSVILQVDAAVNARIENLAGYTVKEHYAVFRGHDEIHSVAEMTVMTTYKKETGKSYTIVSQTGSSLVRDLVLGAILDNEQRLNQPGTREGAWITSANYEMKLKPGGTQPVDGRDCLVLALIPKRKTSYLIEGILWVDSKDGSIVQVQGIASKNSSMVTGPTQVMRQYASIGGYSQATHVRAVSNSFIFGETIVTIDYNDYHIQLRPPG
jgi:hypothetical protein